jgi:hypothetical protein
MNETAYGQWHTAYGKTIRGLAPFFRIGCAYHKFEKVCVSPFERKLDRASGNESKSKVAGVSLNGLPPALFLPRIAGEDEGGGPFFRSVAVPDGITGLSNFFEGTARERG